MADHALFYFRDPAYVESLPSKQQPYFSEIATLEDRKRLGPEEAAKRAAERRVKLFALKDRIRESGLRLKENYANPIELGELVYRDLLWDVTPSSTSWRRRRFHGGARAGNCRGYRDGCVSSLFKGKTR